MMRIITVTTGSVEIHGRLHRLCCLHCDQEPQVGEVVLAGEQQGRYVEREFVIHVSCIEKLLWTADEDYMLDREVAKIARRHGKRPRIPVG